MIDISDEEETTRKCFRSHLNLFGSLNISYNASNSMLCLWNRYQIFIHERLNFEDAAKTLIPEFEIKQTLLVDNYLLCLDFSANIHLISLKFKHSAAKRLKSSFSLKDQNILSIREFGNDVVSLKLENEHCYICTYKISADLQQSRKQRIDVNNIRIETEKCLLYSHALTEQAFESIKSIFKCSNWSWKHHYMLLFSFNQKTLYGCLFSSQTTDEPVSIKLYSCPTEISDIKILNREYPEIIIGLTCGTLIKLVIDTDKSCTIVHLNTCIGKFIEINNSIIYTDGCTMWKADHVFEDITFKQLFIKQTKDLIKCSDQIICTTYNSFIYIFSIDDESIYLKPSSDEEYSSAQHLLNNTQYLQRILEEANKIKGVLKKISNEKNCITTMALSNKPEMMDTVLEYDVSVFDNYEDILKEDKVLTFTDEPKYMFSTEKYYFLITIKTSHLQHNFKDILSHLFGDFRIHITLLTNDKIIKTTTVKVLEELKKINIVTTLSMMKLDLKTDFFVNIKLVSRIPGVLDEKQGLWICLHEKHLPVTAEQFIQTNKSSKHIFLKENHEKLEDLILLNSRKHYGTLFNIMKSPVKLINEQTTYYVKLPSSFKDIFKNEEYWRKCLRISKISNLWQQMSGEDFLKSQNNINFKIANEKCEIMIINDGLSSPIMKVSSANKKVAFDIKNFISKMVHEHFGAS